MERAEKTFGSEKGETRRILKFLRKALLQGEKNSAYTFLKKGYYETYFKRDLEIGPDTRVGPQSENEFKKLRFREQEKAGSDKEKELVLEGGLK